MANVVFVAFNYPPKVGGPASSVPELSKRLAEKGFKIDVVAQKFPGHKDPQTDGVKVHRVRHFAAGPEDTSTGGYLSTIPFMAGKIRALMHGGETDLIHCHDISISPMSALLAKKTTHAPPIVAKYTGDVALEYLLKSSAKRPEEVIDPTGARIYHGGADLHFKILDRIQHYIVSHADYIACPSNFQKKQIEKRTRHAHKAVVLKNAINTSRFKPMPRLKTGMPFTVAYFGRLVRWKGLEYLLDAVAQLSAELEQGALQVRIVGEGPARRALEEKVNAAGLASTVKFPGKIEHKEIPALLSQVDVVASPSLYDPYPHAVLEAMACGKPVIASKVGGIQEQITHGKTGYLVPPFNSHAIYTNLKHLYASKQDRDLIGKNAAATAKKHFSWEETIKDYVTFYERIG